MVEEAEAEKEELETFTSLLSVAICSNLAFAALVLTFFCSLLLKNLPTRAFCFSSRSLLSLEKINDFQIILS